MLQIETIKDFSGFGPFGDRMGEYFHSENMCKTAEGISNTWDTYASFTSEDNSALKYPIEMVQSRFQGNSNGIMFHDDDRNFWFSQSGVFTPTLAHNLSGSMQSFSGIISDNKGRFIYAGWRYVGLYANENPYSTGTVSVTNGSTTVTGSGTTFTSDMVGKRFKVTGDTTFYTVSAYTSATQITLGTAYGGTTGTGKGYVINTNWNDTKWDLGADYFVEKIMETYEDWIFIGYENKIAGINTTDDSINTNVFDLPDNFTIKAIRANTNGLLIGAINELGQSITFLWDGLSDRSITEWTWHNGSVKAIENYGEYYVVATTLGYYKTTGYSYAPLIEEFPDGTPISSSDFIPSNHKKMKIVKDRIFVAVGGQDYNRASSGILVINIKTGLMELIKLNKDFRDNYSAPECLTAYTSSTGGSTDIMFGYNGDNIKVIGRVLTGGADDSFYVTRKLGQGSNMKASVGLKLSLSAKIDSFYGYDKDFNITVSIYDYKTYLSSYGKVKQNATALNQIVFDDIFGYGAKMEVGSEISFVEGPCAGETRHITAVTGDGTNTMTITLDRDLPALPLENNDFQNRNFKIAKRLTITDPQDFQDLYFNLNGLAYGKHFLVKIQIDGANFPLTINEAFFLYEDKGYF